MDGVDPFASSRFTVVDRLGFDFADFNIILLDLLEEHLVLGNLIEYY